MGLMANYVCMYVCIIAGHLLLSLLGNYYANRFVSSCYNSIFSCNSSFYRNKLMSTHSNHPFYLVDYRSSPLTASIGAITTVAGVVKWFHQWRDVCREGTYQGLHTEAVRNNFIYFIRNFIFCLIFWAFFHSSLSPFIELGFI